MRHQELPFSINHLRQPLIRLAFLFLGHLSTKCQRRNWVQRFCGFQVAWCKVGILHSRFQILMAKYPLQGQDVAAVDHQVTSERVAQNMG